MTGDDIEIVLHDARHCTGCNALLRSGSAFCNQCGAQQGGGGESPNPVAMNPATSIPVTSNPEPSGAGAPRLSAGGEPDPSATATVAPPASSAAPLPPLSQPPSADRAGYLPRPAPRTATRTSAKRSSRLDVVAEVVGAVFSLGKGLFWLVGIALLGLMVFGYSHAHTEEFKLECAFQQLGGDQMSFPDNVLCEVFYEPR